MCKRFCVGLAVATLALVMAAPAGAVIRPQKGMAGVRLNMTQAQMRARLGTPARIKQGQNDFGAFTEFFYPHRITVSFQGNHRATAIATRGRSEKTERGIGVGSSVRAVKRKVGHVHCETLSGVHTCHVGRFLAGRRVTDFRIGRRGRVTSVTVGFVID